MIQVTHYNIVDSFISLMGKEKWEQVVKCVIDVDKHIEVYNKRYRGIFAPNLERTLIANGISLEMCTIHMIVDAYFESMESGSRYGFIPTTEREKYIQEEFEDALEKVTVQFIYDPKINFIANIKRFREIGGLSKFHEYSNHIIGLKVAKESVEEARDLFKKENPDVKIV